MLDSKLMTSANEIPGIPKDKIGLVTASGFWYYDQVAEHQYNFSGNRYVEMGGLGINHILALEYGFEGYQREHGNSCGASLKIVHEGARLLQSGEADIVAVGGFDFV